MRTSIIRLAGKQPAGSEVQLGEASSGAVWNAARRRGYIMQNAWSCSGGDEDCLFHRNGRAVGGAVMGAGVGALTG